MPGDDYYSSAKHKEWRRKVLKNHNAHCLDNNAVERFSTEHHPKNLKLCENIAFMTKEEHEETLKLAGR